MDILNMMQQMTRGLTNFDRLVKSVAEKQSRPVQPAIKQPWSVVRPKGESFAVPSYGKQLTTNNFNLQGGTTLKTSKVPTYTNLHSFEQRQGPVINTPPTKVPNSILDTIERENRYNRFQPLPLLDFPYEEKDYY